jgi:uncharacterized membrane protein
MDKMLVAVFDTETAAFEGLSALKDLHQDGDLTVYATAVIVKDAAGAVSIKKADDQGPAGTALGMLIGSMVGLVAGPIGVVVGASATGLAGLVLDLARVGISADFLDDVSQSLIPGKAAVLAEVDETWVTPVDTRIGNLGGLVLRRQRSKFIDDQLNQEAAALDAEMKQLKDELAQTSAKNKAAVQNRINQVRQKLEAKLAQVEAAQKQAEAEMNAKIEAQRAQRAQASRERAAKNEQRIAEIKADYELRRSKLAQARQLIKEALTP